MKKKVQLASVLAAQVMMLSLASANAAKAGDLTVEVQNVEGDRGGVMVGVCVRQEYPSRCGRRQRVNAQDGTVSVVFRGVAAGAYSAMVFHDENNNGQLDSDPSGIPVEGVGFSNNPRGLRGLPTFEQTAFDVSGDAKVAVKMRY